MSEYAIQHSKLDGINDYSDALDKLCKLAEHNLYLFEKNYDGMGFNSETRYSTLRNFLLSSPSHRLYVLAHDTRWLSTQCPRMMMLLRQFGASMFIHQTPKHLQNITEPFSIADDSSFVRRFHFDDPRGILGTNDPETARVLQSRFMEMWSASRQGISSTTSGL
ncbi:MAG: hypothetical protein ACOY9D_08225 [Pseudomonadota bacterium]